MIKYLFKGPYFYIVFFYVLCNFVPAPITPLYTFFPCDYLCFFFIEEKQWPRRFEFLDTSNVFYTSLPLYATQIINPFLNSGISTNHDKVD